MKKLTRVLILEDDEGHRPLLGTILQSVWPGVSIDWASDAEQALARIKQTLSGNAPSYELIVADVFLEGDMTGLDFWRACKVLVGSTPVVIVSSMPRDFFRKSLEREAALPPYLGKPLSIEECRKFFSSLFTGGRR